MLDCTFYSYWQNPSPTVTVFLAFFSLKLPRDPEKFRGAVNIYKQVFSILQVKRNKKEASTNWLTIVHFTHNHTLKMVQQDRVCLQRVILLVDTAKAGAWSLESGCCVTRCPAERRRRSQGKPRSWNRRQPVRLRLRRRILRLRNQGKPPGQAEHRAALQVPTFA